MFDIEQEQIDKRKRLLYLIKIHLPASLHGGMQFLVLALDQQSINPSNCVKASPPENVTPPPGFR